jgi:hypothetical protein
MVNNTVLQWSRLHLSLPTKFYSSTLNDRPHSRWCFTPTSPCGVWLLASYDRLPLNLKFSCLRGREENHSRKSGSGSSRTNNSGPFMASSLRCSQELNIARSWVRCMQSTATHVFVLDQFKLMPVMWYFSSCFHDNNVYVSVTFPVHSIRPVHIIFLNLIPGTSYSNE